MGLRRILQQWREKADGTLTGPALETDDQTISNSVTYPDGTTVTNTPTFPDNTGVRVGLSSDQSVSNGTLTKIQFDNVVFDKGNEWDTSNFELTANSAGVYLIEITATPNGGDVSDGDKIAVKGRKNGVDVLEGVNLAGSASAFSGQVIALVDLNAGDTLSASVFYKGSNINLDGRDRLTHLSVVRVA